MLKKMAALSLKAKMIVAAAAVAVVGTTAGTAVYFTTGGSNPFLGLGNSVTEMLSPKWPNSFVHEEYIEPVFTDDENRDNNAFNVADFGEQGNNGWFYRYGNPDKPLKSKQMEVFDGESYRQRGVDGLEIKSNFIHTGNGVAPMLEWRVARTGSIDLKLTYVKNANGDANPNWPDGVYIKVYKGDELLESNKVDIKVEEETLLESKIPDLAVEKGESIYIVVDPNTNNAYDGGALYVAVSDAGAEGAVITADLSRKDNNANNVKDFGEQGKNGWCYMYGKDVKSSAPVSDLTEDGYINNTSPGLVISKEFIHPAMNDNAILRWTPAAEGEIDIRGKYAKYEHNDGNPDWPDGVIVQVYLNENKLFEEAVKVPGPGEGANEISFSERKLQVTPQDNLYFVVNANGNSTYDGGGFNISIKDRSGLTDENSVVIDESEIRQNVAKASVDFGAQGNNGWFFQGGYGDEPFGAYNIKNYVKDEKYSEDSYLEIKRDFVNTGETGESAVIKWKVAQNGRIKIDASYTKFKNEDANPDWPDGTRVTLYHNNTVLVQKEFAPDVSKEITKDLNVASLAVKRGDYITMVINGKENNAYDAGSYSFSIDCLSGLVGQTEKDIVVENDELRTNNASVADDLGKQGNNGWFFQYGYHTDPFFAVNIEKYSEENANYTTKDGVEIKKDYIMPSTKDKSANVKWKVAQDGKINVYADYTKLENEDANPSWPDGTVVTLFHNEKVISSKEFAPERTKVKGDLSVLDLEVKKGDYITMIVNGKENTAYDAGLYYFVIEDANEPDIIKVNDSGKNWANLAIDFGAQGNNGWYYLEGESPMKSGFVAETGKDGGICYRSAKARSKDLELGKEFVQPGPVNNAMYQWVAARDGEVDIRGRYTKFGHQDSNPSWPDGVEVKVYLNNEELFQEKVSVLAGDGNDVVSKIKLNRVTVKKGDYLTFAVGALENNSWDGGKLEAQIKPHITSFLTAKSNVASLERDFTGDQASNGWYYGFGNSSDEFEVTAYMAGDQKYFDSIEGVTLKKDGVEPGNDVGAIYRWIAGETGMIDLSGIYTKSKNESGTEIPDGVKVAVYLNGELISGMTYNAEAFADRENIVTIKKQGLEVKRGGVIDFIITAKENRDWDWGKLQMGISPSAFSDSGRTNKANLAEDFSEKQGNNGWYYGRCEWDGKGFSALTYDGAGRYFDNDGLALKKDFVNPGNKGNCAAYKWVAAEDGKIKIRGAYTKYANAGDSAANGVVLRFFQNGSEKTWIGDGINKGGLEQDVPKGFNVRYDVKKGDEIIFSVNSEGNNKLDGGKLEIDIKPVEEEAEEEDPNRTNNADLKADFGKQGSNGWRYGTCDWDGSKFVELDFDDFDPNNLQYKGNHGEVVKADYVEPGWGGEYSAAYKWKAAQDGKIKITGQYVKFNSDGKTKNDAGENLTGVSLKVVHNVFKEGVTPYIRVENITSGERTTPIKKDGQDIVLDVKKGDEIIFAVNPEGNNSYDGGRLEIKIEPASKTTEPERTQGNNANLADDFGEQGSNGWYYGTCDWDGEGFDVLPYDSADGAYCESNKKPKLKGDFVEPGNGKNAAYKWTVAEDGWIKITGSYEKYNTDEDTDGVSLRVFHNNQEKMFRRITKTSDNLINIQNNDNTEMILEVKKGDAIIFAVDPEGNDNWDGGKLVVTIEPVDKPAGQMLEDFIEMDQIMKATEDAYTYKVQSTEFAFVRIVEKGAKVHVIGRVQVDGADWYIIKQGDQELFIEGKFLAKVTLDDLYLEEVGEYRRVTDDAATFAEPSDESDSAGSVVAGEIVYVISKVDVTNWYKISQEVGGTESFVYGSVLGEEVDPKELEKELELGFADEGKTMIAREDADTYKKPSNDSEKGQGVTESEEVTILGRVVGTNWYKIKKGDGEYIEGRFLVDDDSDETEDGEDDDGPDKDTDGDGNREGTVITDSIETSGLGTGGTGIGGIETNGFDNDSKEGENGTDTTPITLDAIITEPLETEKPIETNGTGADEDSVEEETRVKTEVQTEV